MRDDELMQTVVETSEFIRQARACMVEEAIEEFICFIAKHPLLGEIMPGTGGVRKIRWGRERHSGKRGGVRVIYYYYDSSAPIFLLSAYAKNNKIDLASKDKAALKVLVKAIAKNYESKIYE